MNDADLFEQSIIKEIDDAFLDLKDGLREFISGNLRNRHIWGNDIISVYARKATHYVDQAPIKCFDIATIVVDANYRSRGLGMRVIDYIHSINPYRCTYVESILNTNLYDRLKREHWVDVERSTPPCVFKLTPLNRNVIQCT